MAQGVERISSQELSKKMQVTASQIRQDLNHFGGFGQQGYGYNVEYLYVEIAKILGLDKEHNMILIGAGNLGQALANYSSFENSGFVLAGIFDVNPVLKGTSIRGVPIRMMDELKMFIEENKIEIAVLTVPKQNASEVADLLADTNIKGIMNFAHTDLKLPKQMIVENVHVSDSLMKLSYKIGREQEGILEE
jgi:redox-sensing transcriptional repressor